MRTVLEIISENSSTKEALQVVEVPFDIDFGAVEIYKKQFNRDLFFDLQRMGKLTNYKGEDKDEEKDDKILKNTTELLSLMYDVSWAFAKNADETLSTPREWLKQFVSFPVKDIIGHIMPLWSVSMSGSVKIKN